METNYGWESELPALTALDNAAAAEAINAMTVQDRVSVFGSFRTLAALLNQTEYNTLRAALTAAAAQETTAGGSLLADMIEMLKTPGDESGNGGGLDLTSPTFIAMLGQLATAASISDVPGKVAAYVASKQPPPRQKYRWTAAGEIKTARSQV